MLDMSRFYEDDDDGNVKQFKCDDDNLEVVVDASPLHLNVNR